MTKVTYFLYSIDPTISSQHRYDMKKMVHILEDLLPPVTNPYSQLLLTILKRLLIDRSGVTMEFIAVSIQHLSLLELSFCLKRIYITIRKATLPKK